MNFGIIINILMMKIWMMMNYMKKKKFKKKIVLIQILLILQIPPHKNLKNLNNLKKNQQKLINLKLIELVAKHLIFMIILIKII